MIREDVTVEALNQAAANTMVSYLGIEFTAVGTDFLTAKMPVDHRTVQPYRLLHGGASAVLAESVGSMASACCTDPDKEQCVGIEINANHLSSALEGQGLVWGTARPLKLGRRIHVWEIRITDEQDKLICISRLTVAIVPKRF